MTLDIHNASLTKMNANLNVFSNLKHINLSENKIQHISASFLPKSLEILDASYNSIKYLPHDIHLLPNLKEVDFAGNPVFCDCDSISIREELLNMGVSIAHPVKCEYPKEHKGEMWQNVRCKQQTNLYDRMFGDAAYEGSGSEDLIEKSDTSIEKEFIRPTTEVKETTTESNDLEEGSGDDALLPTFTSNETNATDESTEVNEPVILPVGKGELSSGPVRACNFNCSTPSPIESNDTDSLPAPGLFEGIKIIANDLGIIDEHKEDNSTSEATSSEPLDSSTEAKGIVRNENITMDAEIMDKGLNTGDELSKMSESSDKQSHTSFIFLAVFLLAIVCLVVYVVIKKRSSARNNPTAPSNTEEKEDALEEVELLTKPVSGTEKNNGTPEAVPLINGHKANEDDGVKAVNVKEPEPKKEEDVQLRKNFEGRNTLTPEAKRVTIKAGEIPNSTPKTPVLVIRHMNSDGCIVTTPEVDQRV